MNYNSEIQVLLDILGAYRRQIIRSGKEYPNVVISDIFNSINFVLNNYDYEGKYANDKGKNYK
jgi:hypothetical protein